MTPDHGSRRDVACGGEHRARVVGGADDVQGEQHPEHAGEHHHDVPGGHTTGKSAAARDTDNASACHPAAHLRVGRTRSAI
jgi:hypothetical protein